ncbi:hypothetical protein C7K25_10430 [Gulosibacter molinativorax]|uniref:DNA-binding protein n=1 Tax=Gulosibacter molinativorax TaxID=256821 RepID=A0ABT7C9A7_9MICO|nr:hypothetical protein [Gulosibacter molinativorax]
MSPETLGKLIEVSPQTLSDWRKTWRDGKTGEGPRFFKVGRLVRYRLEVVETWLSDLESK